MTRFSWYLSTCLVVGACGGDDDQLPVVVDAAPAADAGLDDFTAEERALLAMLPPLPAVPPDPTNAFADHAGAARLGQMLFFDKSYAGPLVVGDDGTNHGLGRAGETGKVSCHSCHGVGGATLDDRERFVCYCDDLRWGAWGN
jgi:hypothetical protein